MVKMVAFSSVDTFGAKVKGRGGGGGWLACKESADAAKHANTTGTTRDIRCTTVGMNSGNSKMRVVA
jgi:mevalonate kinase